MHCFLIYPCQFYHLKKTPKNIQMKNMHILSEDLIETVLRALYSTNTGFILCFILIYTPVFVLFSDLRKNIFIRLFSFIYIYIYIYMCVCVCVCVCVFV